MVVEGVAWGISVAGWIMSPIISKLLDKVLSHCKSDEAETLRHLLTDALPRLTLTLEAAEDMKHRKLFEAMVRDLKSAFYDMEDILDELEYIRHQKRLNGEKNLRKKRKKNSPKTTSDAQAGSSNQDSFIEPSLELPGNLNGRLKDDMVKIEKLIVAAQGIIALAKPSSKHKTATAKNITTRTTSAPLGKVIGREEDRDRIIEMLRDTKDDVNPISSNSKCFSVIGIYGISGSGKTTLAQHVCKYAEDCKDEEDKKYFDLVMWIHVSQNYSVGDILKEMFEAASIDKEKACPNYHSLDVLERELEKKLDGKRFLLVLDDIWCNKDVSEQQLPKLLSPLKVGKRGSKILATSRNKDAFSDLGPGVARTVFPIPALNEQVFLELFMYYALEDANADDPDQMELKIIGAEIARKLKGSPLAASTVGGQLRKRKNDVDFWKEVQDQDLVSETTGALWWSYQHLDEQVRRCFAYCSIFPRRHPLKRDELVKLWVAEGFIQTTDEEDMEAVGRDYFHELLATSFVQVESEGYYGGDYCYSVHDLMHDLAEKAAGSDCFRIENGFRTKVPHDVRHMFVADAAMVTENIFELKNLRTLIIGHTERKLFNKKFFKKVSEKLQKLRVLAVETTWSSGMDEIDEVDEMGEMDEISAFKIPEDIGHLKHLRYLALLFSEETISLPNTLDKLYHLQVLVFGYPSGVKVAPDIKMGNLTNLRHIIGEIDMQVPNIGRLTSLQTLDQFEVRTEPGHELNQLRDLNKLRGKLTICSLENVRSKQEADEAKLADKKGLTGLELFWGYDTTCTPEFQEDILEGLCPPNGLKSLHIWRYQGVRYPSWMVGEQNGCPKYLHELSLRDCSGLGPAPELFEFFIHLRELTIWTCDWVYLPDNVKDLRSLKSLSIIDCSYLKLLPELPPSLEKLLVSYCNKEFMRSCEHKDHPNWQKIQHVDVKDIGYSWIPIPMRR